MEKMKQAVTIVLTLLLAFVVSCQETENTREEKAKKIMEQEVLRGILRKSKIDEAKLLIEQIVLKLELYQLDVANYPSEDEGGLNALATKPTFDDESQAEKWAGPYIKRKQLKDPWGNDLGYELVEEEVGDTTRMVIHVWSYGPNGEDDSGEGDDIKSWED
jgi:type II secretion system protein G